MTEIRYTSARDAKWIAMVGAFRVLVVDRTVGADRAGELWSSVHEGEDTRSVLDVLTRGGISSAPPFALIDAAAEFGTHPAQVSVIVRGQFELLVRTADEHATISGEGVSTWVERTVPDALSVEIGRADVSRRSTSALEEFVLGEGSAPVSWLLVGTPGDTSTESAVEAVAPKSAPKATMKDDPVATRVTVLPTADTPTDASDVDATSDPGMTITDAPTSSQDAAAGSGSGYDFLFGETVVRTVEDAAVRPEESVTSARAGDHDGRTAIGLTAAERRAARQARQKATPAPAVSPRFSLDFSTGITEVLDSPVIVGRAPSASKVSVNSVPRLVTVGGPDQDISRNHVQVSLEGGTVMVTDLHSRNGTMVTLPDRPPQQLRGGQPTAVIDGAIIDLGSGVTITVREH